MNTKQLHYILAIAEEGGLTAAAEKLHITQPALSKYLAELEKELGTELFFQHKKRYYPTAAGKIYLDAASRIIAVKEQTYQMISELSVGYQKTITIGVTPLRGAIAIAKIFNLFHKHPDIIVVERPSVLEVSLRLIAQSSMVLPYRIRYYSPRLYSYHRLVIEALRVSPQFSQFNVDYL